MDFRQNKHSTDYIEKMTGLSLESLTNLSSESVLFFRNNKKDVKITTDNGLNYNVSLESRSLILDYLFTMHKFNIQSILSGKIGIDDEELDIYLSKKKKYIPVVKEVLTCC